MHGACVRVTCRTCLYLCVTPLLGYSVCPPQAVSHLRLEDTLKQFAAPLKEQVDLAREASNLQRFNFNFRHTPAVQFPVPLYPLVRGAAHVRPQCC